MLVKAHAARDIGLSDLHGRRTGCRWRRSLLTLLCTLLPVSAALGGVGLVAWDHALRLAGLVAIVDMSRGLWTTVAQLRFADTRTGAQRGGCPPRPGLLVAFLWPAPRRCSVLHAPCYAIVAPDARPSAAMAIQPVARSAARISLSVFDRKRGRRPRRDRALTPCLPLIVDAVDESGWRVMLHGGG
jgi:hypothetical protein